MEPGYLKFQSFGCIIESVDSVSRDGPDVTCEIQYKMKVDLCTPHVHCIICRSTFVCMVITRVYILFVILIIE